MAYSLTTWNEFKNYQRRRDLREGELVDGDYTQLYDFEAQGLTKKMCIDSHV